MSGNAEMQWKLTSFLRSYATCKESIGNSSGVANIAKVGSANIVVIANIAETEDIVTAAAAQS